MRLLHEFENNERSALVYLTSDRKYVVVTCVATEDIIDASSEEEAEIIAENFVLKE